jgi:NAD(P)-dependent dehydrogenase (short-subunit alcohol dehydrogenase family)
MQGLGLEYAKALAAAGCHCLVLTGRSPALPPEALAGFAAAGVTVFTVAADAEDSAAWESLLCWAHERLPALQHFAHAAGVTGFDLLHVSEAAGHSMYSKAYMAHYRMLQVIATGNLEKPVEIRFHGISPLFPQRGCLCCHSSSSPAGLNLGKSGRNCFRAVSPLFAQQGCLCCHNSSSPAGWKPEETWGKLFWCCFLNEDACPVPNLTGSTVSAWPEGLARCC